MIVVALLIPVTGPVEEIELDGSLAQLQGLVGGHIEAVALPAFIRGADEATAYVNEEGKFRHDLERNGRATDLFVPGAGLLYGDHIAGPCLIVGFDARTGEHRPAVPDPVAGRVRLIEREAGR